MHYPGLQLSKGLDPLLGEFAHPDDWKIISKELEDAEEPKVQGWENEELDQCLVTWEKRGVPHWFMSPAMFNIIYSQSDSRQYNRKVVKHAALLRKTMAQCGTLNPGMFGGENRRLWVRLEDYILNREKAAKKLLSYIKSKGPSLNLDRSMSIAILLACKPESISRDMVIETVRVAIYRGDRSDSRKDSVRKIVEDAEKRFSRVLDRWRKS